VLFLKIMLFMDFNNFCIPHFFLTSFWPSTKLPWHTCRPFVSHSWKMLLYIIRNIHCTKILWEEDTYTDLSVPHI
jgi:hypothetical protein